MRTVIIVQARMTSSRLPGKVLLPVLGKPLLAYQMERLQHVQQADAVVVATTINKEDELIVQCCENLKVPFFRGDEEDVLLRYYQAAVEYQADIVVRVTADCPLIDPEVVDLVLGSYLRLNSDFDYISNTLERTFPRGMDTEVFSFGMLNQANIEAKKRYEREHVTPFFYKNPDRYRLKNVSYSSDKSFYRWTVDTPEDFKLILRVLEALYPIKKEFSMEDCFDLMQKNPNWIKINKNIEQKILEE